MLARSQPDRAVTSAFQYALVIFTLTALIGLANATQLFGTIDRNTLLTHLHSGTLGWITMGVIGLTVWIFGGTGLNTAVRLSAASTAAYVLAFWSGNFVARATFGVTELLVIYYWWWFAVSRGMAEGFGRLDTPKLSVIFGLTTLVIGSTIGVLVQVLLATGQTLPTTPDLVGGHAAAQVGGYLVLVAAGFVEWQLTGGGKRTAAGVAQIALLFIAGLAFSVGALTNNAQLLQLATPLQIAGIIVIAARFGRAVVTAPWGTASGTRHLAISVGYLALGVVLFAVLIQQFIAAQGDFTKVSLGLLHAADHVYFVGLMTNVLFGAILVATADRPRVWPWADHLIFWGLNLGAAAFIAVLIFIGSGEGKAAFAHPVAFTAPIMGLSVLLGIATFLMRLQGAPVMAATPARV